MTVLVIGSTGNVGSAVVRELLGRGVAPRAFVRDPERAAGVLGEHVELAAGDLADRTSLERAFAGVERVFLACGNQPDQVALECAAIDVARERTVEQLVKLSGPAPRPDSPQLFERWHARIEKHLAAAGVPAVLLHPASFMTNLLALAPAVAQQGALFAAAGTGRVAFVDPADVGAVAAALLAEGPGPERALDVTGPEALGYADVARALSEATGRQVRYVDVPEQAARQGLLAAGAPAFLADAVVAVFAQQRAGQFARTTDAVPALAGRPARTVADFVRHHAAAFGGAPPASASEGERDDAAQPVRSR